MNQEHIDIISDGNYTPGEFAEYDVINIAFGTNKNNYTLQDLVDGQGIRGGRVVLPNNHKITYMWCESRESGGASYIEFDDFEPSIWNDPNIVIEFPQLSLGGMVGGWILNPTITPVGEYTFEYSTGDGLQHSETFYLHENRSETYFSIIPALEVDEGDSSTVLISDSRMSTATYLKSHL